jgi:hypothetical protein
MLANGARIEPRVALAAPQLELAAFPSHLARMLAHCLEADFDDVDQRTYVKKHALPKLIKHRRDLLQGSRYGWLDRSAAYRADVLERCKTIRLVVLGVHRNLSDREPSNIISIDSFRLRPGS